MDKGELQRQLYGLQDLKYRDMQIRIIPAINPESIIGVKMLMDHFLDDDYDPAYPEMVAKLRSEEYYVAIQKSLESRRITEEQKMYLRSLKVEKCGRNL